MCGIAAEIRFDGRAPDLGGIHRINERQAQRGPDAAGAYAQDHMAFGHRRLKVMDRSDLSHQPMFDPELGIGVVFNGAIYNHPELRQRLRGRGYRFHSSGDTEVLIKAYHAYGADFVQHLQGMFSIALWERDSGRVLLARDRLGIKPLYYADVDGGVRIASTLPGLLAAGGVDTGIDPVALHHYMSFHAVVPAPYTILKGVRKLPPATLMSITPDGERKSRVYWTPRFERGEGDLKRSFDEWRELVLGALRTAVKRRLVADVPVGVLLSGGLDSSLIVGLLSELGQKDLRTYSVGFADVGGERGNEFQYSDIVAGHFATNHHRIVVDSDTDQLLPALADAVAAMSEPMVSHDAVGFYMLSERVSRDIKVVQSGQGADEVFGGYHWYPPMVESDDPLNDYAQAFFDRDHAEFQRAVTPPWVSKDFSREFVGDQFATPGAETAADKALRLDTTVMLVDDPVKRVDNMTMAWGLEARVPFLDHELVELAARIPPKAKIAGGGKHVLKEAARSVIPAEVIDRPKGYFPVPALKYIRGPVLDFVRDVLDRPAAQNRGVFDRGYVDTLLQDPEGHITPLRGSKLWQIACLETWLQAQGV
ncbi:MAG TPA: N-acetylglutaminylglutamine amidotransferase [Gammaproteobacteria bacterium]|nr:N-acetylglutaminylglutamine amidotransferase [Gammaproteobacteria bacterium]